LKDAGLRTEPDFESAYIDAPITFQLAQPEPTEEAKEDAEAEPVAESQVYDDPTYRISKLAAANNTPVSVKPDASLESAITTMLLYDYSQLPVMTNEREVKGTLTWESIGARLALGKAKGPVRDFMEPHAEAPASASLFNVIGHIVDKQYVLVRGADRTIMGIVTASDLSLQFRQLTEPFLLLGEIENHVRLLIAERFKVKDLKAAVDPDEGDREVAGVSDLTFGEYIRLLQNPESWKKLKTEVDRGVFVARLDRVRQIRNDVMHFDPDGIPDEDLDVLRDFARFLENLKGYELA
jgi:CBS domain-containing protein